MKPILRYLGVLSGLGLATIALAIIMAVTGTGFTVVNDGERGVLKTGTQYEMLELPPGYHFFTPIYQTVDVQPVRPILINYSKTEYDAKDSELLIYEPMLEGLDKKGIPIKLALSIEVRPVSNQLSEMYKSDGDFANSFYKKVKQPNREAVQTTLSKFSVDTIMDQRPQVEKTLTDLIKKTYAKNPYFTLVAINLKDIVLPEEIRRKQLEVQTAKQEALKSNELIKKAENEAKSRAAEAKGIADKARIESQGKADAILIEATAKSKANYLISKSITNNILRADSIQAWREGGAQVPTVGETIPFIGTIKDLK